MYVFLRYGDFVARWGTYTDKHLPEDLYCHEIIYTCDVQTLLKDATSCWFGIPTVIGFYDGKPSNSFKQKMYHFGHWLKMSTVCAEIETSPDSILTLILAAPYNTTDLQLVTRRIKQYISSETDQQMHWFQDKPPKYFFDKWNGRIGVSLIICSCPLRYNQVLMCE